jgi:hypothetical protein
MIERKAAGHKIKVFPFRQKEPTREEDLVQMLEQSLRWASRR